MAEKIIAPEVRAALDTLCLEGSEYSLLKIGASLQDCDPLSVPDSEEDVNEEAESIILTEPYGLPGSDGQDCAGGGTIVVNKNTTYLTIVFIKSTVGAMTTDELYGEAESLAAEEFRINRQQLLLSQPGQECVTLECERDCEGTSSWDRQFKVTRKIIKKKFFELGDNEVVFAIAIELTTKEKYTLNVSCICPENKIN